MVEIRLAILEDIPHIKVLMQETFGRFDRLEELFEKWITQPGFLVSLAIEKEALIGVCSWYLKSDSDLSKYQSFGEDALKFMENKRSAWALNLVIVPEKRHRGLGTRLALFAKGWLKEQRCDIIVGSSWVNGSQDNSARLFRTAGFRVLGESEIFLRHQMQQGAECSVCKTSECQCRSILFGIEYYQFEKFASLRSP